MTAYALPLPPVPALSIDGDAARFPVRRIFCVGRNYAEHAREMGADDREPPFFFTKPGDALVTDDADIAYPPATADLHHEAELVVALGRGGADIAAAAALDHVWGYAAGNDLTRRDLQAEAKAARRPWDMAKGFDASAICGALRPAARIGHPARGRIACHVDGVLRQEGDLGDMIWSVPEIVSHLSRLVALAPGDLIYTGTPAGVGAIARGQTCSVEIEGVGRVSTRVL
ncbi:FAA hydrolase family protein [Rhodovulum sp. BSW8]|uniref:Fumarylacetoacetate hydrolase family protein n=1 Tax=Rhodovulum visakhapatnamense TaxID=364297 RepID=A0ABS1RJ02_9RHOB|nr:MULTISPECIES: fumarylacetoacetate hydrolase family protein [Rhodovulum]MBL3569006.1 fumarylacetoacetate hydrolase family protein [Rhodovulum visakhapatnamense]MBL3579608.1 fumarylacetoacetate hydrolase family protein [Rhodovulum visakhapatnamense]OLS43559.1 fumarylacetoacetate hydrolase [Rhodovulum sulfidophilum]RBO51243.1 FAA hydrolase family protein [Rhodovulum sp. BSW8]